MQIQHWEIYILCLRKNIYNTFKYNFNSKEILCKFISFHINKSAVTDEEKNKKINFVEQTSVEENEIIIMHKRVSH